MGSGANAVPGPGLTRIAFRGGLGSIILVLIVEPKNTFVKSVLFIVSVARKPGERPGGRLQTFERSPLNSDLYCSRIGCRNYSG
jgi:hypothetical protein